MYSLFTSSLASNKIDRFASATNRARGRARLVSARAIAHVSLKDLQAVNSLAYCSCISDWKLSDNSGEETGARNGTCHHFLSVYGPA